MEDQGNTQTQIIAAATRFVQTVGYCAFSYADIAAEVGIRKASIHYYFPGKADLGVAVVSCYRESVREKAAAILRRTPDPGEQLQRYAQIYRDMGRGAGPWDTGRICACAALVAEGDALSDGVRREVQAFFQENEAWLTAILDAGRTDGSLSFAGDAVVQASALLSGLHGAMLAARARRDITWYCAVAHQLLAQLGLNTLDIYPLDSVGAPLPSALLSPLILTFHFPNKAVFSIWCKAMLKLACVQSRGVTSFGT